MVVGVVVPASNNGDCQTKGNERGREHGEGRKQGNERKGTGSVGEGLPTTDAFYAVGAIRKLQKA